MLRAEIWPYKESWQRGALQPKKSLRVLSFEQCDVKSG